VPELHECVDNGMEKLVAIWDDIGIVGEQRSARNRVVLMHLGNLLDEMVREEDQLRIRLKQNVDKYRTEVTRLCTELNLSLYEVCHHVARFKVSNIYLIYMWLLLFADKRASLVRFRFADSCVPFLQM